MNHTQLWLFFMQAVPITLVKDHGRSSIYSGSWLHNLTPEISFFYCLSTICRQITLLIKKKHVLSRNNKQVHPIIIVNIMIKVILAALLREGRLIKVKNILHACMDNPRMLHELYFTQQWIQRFFGGWWWCMWGEGVAFLLTWAEYTNGPSSVRRRPHFQSLISLKPVGQSWSNFMCSITAMGERLHKVLGQIGSNLWFLWQQKAPIDL